MGKCWEKVTLATFFGLFLIYSVGAVSINTLGEPYDSQVVSPNSPVAQVVELIDAEGEPVNKSSLQNNSLQFSYVYEGNKSSVDYLSGGYYYGMFQTGSAVEDVEFEIIDQSISGELNKTEDLETGTLDVDILSNFSSNLHPEHDLMVEVQVNDNTDYYVVDTDDSYSITSGDIILRDLGGSGTYSKNPDPIFAGATPENEVSLSRSNPWSDTQNPVAFNDSNFGNGWDAGEDLILVDYNDGGTVSTSADEPMNAGKNSEVNVDAGAPMLSLSDIRSEVYFVSSDMQYDAGEATVFDNDTDQVYTATPDSQVAGEIPPEGSAVTHEDSMPDSWDISSYDASSGDAWDPSTDFLAIDQDNDSFYTARADVILGGDDLSPGTSLAKSGYDGWNDEDKGVQTSGDLEVHDENSGNSWNPTVDAIWIEEGTTNGYQSSQDTLIAPNSADDGILPNKTGSIFAQWNTISAYDSGSTSSFDPSVDAVIRDFHGGGTYSAGEDPKIAGTIPTGFTGGTGYSQVDGFASSWELDARQPVENVDWSGSRDTILIDQNEGGTYSKVADEVIAAEGSVESAAGTSLRRLNTVTSEDIMWVDGNGNGNYDVGDEIFRDLDQDGQYTIQSDQHLAGVALDVSGSGTPLRTYNNWRYKQKPVLFKDRSSGYGWDISEDSIVHDVDADAVYTSRGDLIIGGNKGDGSTGDSLMSTDRTNFTTSDVYARITSGKNTNSVELGRNPDGVYTGTVSIPDQFGTNFLVQVEAENPTARTGGFASKAVETRVQGIGFGTLESEINIEAQRKRTYTRNVTLENYLETENTVNVNVSEELRNITSIGTEQVQITPNGNETVQFEFNMSEMGSHQGSLIFTEVESGKQDTVDVDINAPECFQMTENLCRLDEGDIFVSVDERKTVNRKLEIMSLTEGSQEVSFTTNGNISDYVSVKNEVNISGTEEVELNVTPERPGNFTGSLGISAGDETMEVNLSLEANVIQLESRFELTPGELNMGTIPRGSDQSREIEMENTGTLDLSNISVASGKYTVSSDISSSLKKSNSQNFSITLEGITASSGKVTVSADSPETTLTREISVSSTLVKPASEMKSDIRTRISSLRTKASSESTMNRLTNLQTKTSSVQTQWDKGNYEQAQQIHQSTTSTLDSLQTEIDSNPAPEPGQSDENSDNLSSGGGGGILIILILLIIILGAGFVVYSSYYPEEGDPLYDVLGDRE